MIKVLVTGSEGQLGKCLQKIAVNYDSLDCKFMNSKGLDITDGKSIISAFESEHFDYCINCAAYTNVEQAEITQDISFLVNAYGVKQLAIQCNKHDVILIHISTDYVFDGSKNGAYCVDDIPNPINEYGRSKLLGEQYIQEILKKYFIVRTSWLYSESGHNFLKTMLGFQDIKQRVKVVNNQIGSPTSVLDLGAFLFFLINDGDKKFGIYHFCNKGITSWYGFAKEIFHQSGIKMAVFPISADAINYMAKRPLNSALNIKKTEDIFQFKIPEWQESLANVLQSLKNKN